MSTIKYIEGDLFLGVDTMTAVAGEQTIIIPHVCNSVGGFGAGFVIPLRRKYPSTETAYRKWFAGEELPDTISFPGDNKFGLGKTQMFQVAKTNHTTVIVANMIAQEGTGGFRPLRYNALAACMDQVAREAKNTYVNPVIVAPMLGSGLAGGNWLFIESLIQDAWIKKGLDVMIFYLANSIPSNWTPPTDTN